MPSSGVPSCPAVSHGAQTLFSLSVPDRIWQNLCVGAQCHCNECIPFKINLPLISQSKRERCRQRKLLPTVNSPKTCNSQNDGTDAEIQEPQPGLPRERQKCMGFSQAQNQEEAGVRSQSQSPSPSTLQWAEHLSHQTKQLYVSTLKWTIKQLLKSQNFLFIVLFFVFKVCSPNQLQDPWHII